MLTEDDARLFALRLGDLQRDAEALYQWGLSVGVPKELARGSMTVNRYSTMRAHANLRNWLGFERLRLAPQAQFEIRQYAEAVGRALAVHFPRTWGLFTEGGAR